MSLDDQERRGGSAGINDQIIQESFSRHYREHDDPAFDIQLDPDAQQQPQNFAAAVEEGEFIEEAPPNRRRLYLVGGVSVVLVVAAFTAATLMQKKKEHELPPELAAAVTTLPAIGGPGAGEQTPVVPAATGGTEPQPQVAIATSDQVAQAGQGGVAPNGVGVAPANGLNIKQLQTPGTQAGQPAAAPQPLAQPQQVAANAVPVTAPVQPQVAINTQGAVVQQAPPAVAAVQPLKPAATQAVPQQAVAAPATAVADATKPTVKAVPQKEIKPIQAEKQPSPVAANHPVPQKTVSAPMPASKVVASSVKTALQEEKAAAPIAKVVSPKVVPPVIELKAKAIPPAGPASTNVRAIGNEDTLGERSIANDVKPLVTVTADQISLRGLSSESLTIGNGEANRKFKVGDYLPTGEKILHIDSIASTVVTDKKIIRIVN